MRTTINLDEDVLLAVKERARREGRTAGEVLSELARLALTGKVVPEQRVAKEEEPSHLGFRPFPSRPGVVVTNELINQLREEEPE
jgi:hypothetical protein